MKYLHIQEARFLSRPNRFIAHVDLHGEEIVCHVKNTGRCKELLLPGAKVLLEKAMDTKRRTAYDLVSVWKGRRLINMDSQAPNKIFAEWAKNGGIPALTKLLGEQKYGDSRFDFYLEQEGQPGYAEIKGVTLEKDGIALFPDAPTERGVKHIRELIRAKAAGFAAYLIFIIQMADVDYFTPNRETQPEFATALKEAEAAGVQLLALDCLVTQDTVTARQKVPIKI